MAYEPVERRAAYDLRHSFARALTHEGRSVICVARHLGHNAAITLSTYGHVIDEFEDSPALDVEAAISAALGSSVAPQLPMANVGSGTLA